MSSPLNLTVPGYNWILVVGTSSWFCLQWESGEGGKSGRHYQNHCGFSTLRPSSPPGAVAMATAGTPWMWTLGALITALILGVTGN